MSTGRAAGAAADARDVDGGTTSLRSPQFKLGSGQWRLTFDYTFGHDAGAGSADFLRVSVLSGGVATTASGRSSAPARTETPTWTEASAVLDPLEGQEHPTAVRGARRRARTTSSRQQSTTSASTSPDLKCRSLHRRGRRRLEWHCQRGSPPLILALTAPVAGAATTEFPDGYRGLPHVRGDGGGDRCRRRGASGDHPQVQHRPELRGPADLGRQDQRSRRQG